MAVISRNTSILDEVIMSKIYLIRGRKVMLDRDLAELYGVETKQLKRAVRRNIKRFPEDFIFEMTKEVWKIGGANLAPPIKREWDLEYHHLYFLSKVFQCYQVY